MKKIEIDNTLPTVVIFGRTNVGKSTLFNTLVEKRAALVSDVHGTTRDSNIDEVEWNNYCFEIIDTGGIIDTEILLEKKKGKLKLSTENDIDFQVQKQAKEYLDKADLILFLVNTREGVLPTDKELSKYLQKVTIKSKIMLIANKADSPKLRRETAEFNKLALDEPLAISATTGSGTGDMLDVIVAKLKKIKKVSKSKKIIPDKKDHINVCILGKPNVGKSSLVNRILGEERIIISPVAHTTREPQDTQIKYKDKFINLIDTAGISKQGKKNTKKTRYKQTIEKYSIDKSLAILKKAEIVLLVLDVNEGLTQQDSKLVEEAINRNVSIILIANKWDLVEERNTKEYTMNINRSLPFIKWAPIQFTSALTGNKVDKVLDLILEIDEKRRTRIGDNALNKFLKKIIKKHKPVRYSGTKHPYIHELTQIGSNPPKFLLRIGSKDTLATTYIRFVENQIREKFDFVGTPIYVKVIKNKKIHGKHEQFEIEAKRKLEKQMRYEKELEEEIEKKAKKEKMNIKSSDNRIGTKVSGKIN